MAQLISINISAAKGERKKPAGRARLRTGHGIVGDGHAGSWHRQVSLLAQESIEKMKRKGLDVGPGDFAENLTTQGIDLPALPVGTRLWLGPALVRVTQIGKECHDRCEIFRRAGDCVMPREGIFTEVLQGGVIHDGDEIQVLAARGDSSEAEPGDAPASESVTDMADTHPEQEETGAPRRFSAAVITVSDSCFSGEREDGSGDLLERLLAEAGASTVIRILVPDERGQIAAALNDLCRGQRIGLVITTGGTGLMARDVTPEATRDVIDREAPGIAEAIRAASMRITPRAMLSRSVSGVCAASLIVNLPGSPKACAESFAVVRPVLGHALELLAGHGGECAR